MDVEQLAMLDSAPGFRAPVSRVQGDESEEHVAGLLYSRSNRRDGDEHPDAGPATESKGKKGKSKAKANTAPAPTPIPIPGAGLSGLEHEPHLIETIDKQQSFKMFNEGWILPPDQKRGGRARVERPPPPPPKKKKSRVYRTLFVRVFTDLSSAAGQPPISKSPPTNQWNYRSHLQPSQQRTSWMLTWNLNLNLQPQPNLTDPTINRTRTMGTVSDTGLPVQSIQESVDSRGNRIVIIEELDTPATRREKTRRAKAERARLAAEVEPYDKRPRGIRLGGT
jgi:hypothetical protein